MLISLFPSPVIHHQFDLNPGLLQWVKDYHKQGEHDSNSSSCGWHSKYDLHEDQNFLNHFLVLHANIAHGLHHLTPAPFTIKSMWASINGPGDFNMSHLHAGVDFSGVYWLQTPESSGDIVFENDKAITRYNWKIPEDVRDDYSLHDSTWFKPMKGYMLIFPADLRHRVDRNESQEDRISIGFNIKLR